jgi:hypothetical protein
MIKRLNMPYLFIKCKNSPYYEDKKYYDEALEAMQKYNSKFEVHNVEGKFFQYIFLTHSKKN